MANTQHKYEAGLRSPSAVTSIMNIESRVTAGISRLGGLCFELSNSLQLLQCLLAASSADFTANFDFFLELTFLFAFLFVFVFQGVM